MQRPDEIVRALRERGDLSEPAPGIVALHGKTAALMHVLEQTIATLCRGESRRVAHSAGDRISRARACGVLRLLPAVADTRLPPERR